MSKSRAEVERAYMDAFDILDSLKHRNRGDVNISVEHIAAELLARRAHNENRLDHAEDHRYLRNLVNKVGAAADVARDYLTRIARR